MKEPTVEIPVRYLNYMSIIIANVDHYTFEQMKDYVNGPLMKMANEIHAKAIEKGIDVDAIAKDFMAGFARFQEQIQAAKN